MNWIDTHAHVYDEAFLEDLPTVMAQTAAQGVTKILMPNCDSSTYEGMMQVASQYPDQCYPMIGLHPVYVKANYRDELAFHEKKLHDHPFVAIGEIGLDYHWDKTFIEEQKIALRTQIEWAKAMDLPIVIHSRESTDDCIQLIKSMQDGRLRGVFHCFTGSYETAQRIIDMGLYLGIGGVLTYKNAKLPEQLKKVDSAFVMLETDAPYLSPMPYRGKRNESTYIPIVGAALANVWECSVEEVATITTTNALRLFNKNL